ncbi:MAG: sigma 54-interacting transcriptional regulator [bacterium]
MINLSHERLMALFEISHKINRIKDLQVLLDEILHSAIGNIGAERGLIILADETGESYRTVASKSLKDDDIRFSRSIVKETLERRQTFLSPDIDEDAGFKEKDSVRELNILSFICVPLIVPEATQALGTLYVDRRIGKKAFTQEDVAFLEAFANLAAIAINNTSLMKTVIDENIRLRKEVEAKYEFSGVIGHSEPMQEVFARMQHVLNDNCTVLLTGESGSGKEVIAKAIHYNGERRTKPFLAINCGALPETLLEAELFGSVRGAFTGAVDKPGLFQAAHGGTLFLDEIQHTSEAMQIKLLRVLQDREIRRVGGTSSNKVDVRLVCATNEDLSRAIQKGNFRQDFYYRINVITINVPPLRDRRDDIPILAQHFLEKYATAKRKSFQGFDTKALDALVKHDWVENNVRELENEIERAAIYAKTGSMIQLNDLSEKIKGALPTAIYKASAALDETETPLTYDELEKEYINRILSQVAGNQTEAAKIMGIPRTTLRGKMKKLGLTK